jgi:cyclin-dependent kinase 7
MPVGQFPKTPLRDLFTAASADTLNLLSKCLIYEPRRRISAKEVCSFLLFLLLELNIVTQALYHPYFTALPYPTHPSKLPKCTTQQASRALEEVDGNVDMADSGPGVKAKNSKLKRKLGSPADDSKTRSIARRLDFTKQTPNT